MSDEKADQPKDDQQPQQALTLEELYKQVGIVAVAAAAPYVTKSKSRRAA